MIQLTPSPDDPNPQRRIVALTCSNTEIVCALGCASMLVGVDNHSDYPEEVVAALPRVGPDLQIDIDKVAALSPDLVLASLTVPGHEKIVEGLERAGIPHLAPEPVSLADVFDDIRTIAEAIGVTHRAERLIQQIRAEIPEIPAQPADDAPSILVQWWPKPVIAPGRQSWVHDLILAAGGRNPIGHEEVKSRPMTFEEVRDMNPDAFVISWCGVKLEKYRPDVLYNQALWQDLPAIQDRRIHCITEAYLGRPSPRLIDGYRALRAVVEACKATP